MRAGLFAAIYLPTVKVHPSRIAGLDWSGEGGLDQVLAAATRLDAGRISPMRLVPGEPERAGLLHSFRVTWCSLCVRGDVAGHGEAYERAVWRLGWCVACPVHGCLLSDSCPSCLGTCRFDPVAGRQRLVCTICRAPVDVVRRVKVRPSGMGGFGVAVRPAPTVSASVLALQQSLLAASMGTDPTGPLGFSLGADAFLSLVLGLTAPLAWPLPSEEAMTAALAQDVRTPGALPLLELHRHLGIVGALLGSAANTAQPDREVPTTPGKSATMTDLASLFGGFPQWYCELLRRRAPAWGTALAPIVIGALDVVDERIRRTAVQAERSREEAAQAYRAAATARHETKRAEADVRRGRARRIRQAAMARLPNAQTHEISSSRRRA